MKKRKLFLCALAALTAALTLSGCAGNSSAGESSASAEKESSKPSDSLADVELVVSDGSAKVTIENGKFTASRSGFAVRIPRGTTGTISAAISMHPSGRSISMRSTRRASIPPASGFCAAAMRASASTRTAVSPA